MRRTFDNCQLRVIEILKQLIVFFVYVKSGKSELVRLHTRSSDEGKSVLLKDKSVESVTCTQDKIDASPI